MKRNWPHSPLLLALTLLTIAAAWGALQLAPFDRDDRMWDLSTADVHRQLGIRRGGLAYVKVDLNATTGSPGKHQYSLLGSEYRSERRQLVNPQMLSNPPEPKDRESRLNATAIDMTSIDLRLWQLAVLFGLYPLLVTLAALRRWARLKRNPNACRHCYYDLTGNESGACPECGSAIPTDTATQSTA